MTRIDSSLGKCIGRDDEPDGGLAPAIDAQIISEQNNEGILAVPAEAQSKIPIPSDLATVFLGGLFILAALAALNIASAIILPVVLAFVLAHLLQPAMRLLERFYVPRGIGALLTILLVIGGFIGFGTALSGPAGSWAAKLPEGLPRLVEHLRFLQTPFDVLQQFLHQAERVAAGPVQSGTTIDVQGGFSDTLFRGVRTLIDGLFTTVLVLYFLLVSGDTFLRRFVEILPRFQDKRQAVDISQHIEHDVSAYLVTITAMNAVVGAATGTAMYFCGLGDPVLWGAVAFFLNYVPIIGPLTGTVTFFLAGLLSLDSLWRALLPVALYLAIHLIEGEIVTPILLARRFTLNPVVVILSLIFWFWMWGIPGAILSMPMLAIIKIVCDRIRPLIALGHFLEG
jgi:predicted PurR-regulated permease PerM